MKKIIFILSAVLFSTNLCFAQSKNETKNISYLDEISSNNISGTETNKQDRINYLKSANKDINCLEALNSISSRSTDCIECEGTQTYLQGDLFLAGGFVAYGETFSFETASTCVRFWGENSLMEFSSYHSGIQINNETGFLTLGGTNSYFDIQGVNSTLGMNGTSNFDMGSSAYLRYRNNSTGSGTPAFGSNCPATTLTAPYTWLKMKSSDGSIVYVPAWK